MKNWNKNWITPIRVLLAGAGIAASAMLVPLVVSAVAPAANTVIGNQAAASYTDASGKTQSASSNQVNTTVAQIGGDTLSNTGNKTAAAGNTVYVPHTLTNTGNGTDSFTITAVDNGATGTFSNVVIYADPNGTGVPSGAPLCASPVSGSIPLCTTGFVQPVGGNGGTFNFVAAYTIPSTATTPTTPFDTATITVVPVASTPAIPYPSGTVSRTDTVNLTTLAAFASNKAIAKPAVAAPSTLSAGWPAALTSGKASDASCAATVAGVNTAAANCTYTVYTIGYNNTGGATGSYSMSDTLPTGLTYVPGTAVWSGAGGTALSESGGSTGTTPNLIASTFAAGKFSATVSNVAPNTAGSISFVVMVNNTALAGSTTTTNTALYSTTDCNAACVATTPPSTPTNPSPFPVTPTYAVIAANVSTATTFDATTPPPKTGVELVDVPSAFLGNKVKFTDYVINKGNVTDSFNVAIAATGANNNFPVGTTFAFFKADGVTPLLDTTGDSIPDTGPLAPNASVSIVVVASLPGTAIIGTAPFDALMTASSVGAGTVTPVIDSVWEQVDSILSAKVDLTNTAAGNLTSTDGGTTTVACTADSNCDLGQGPSTNPTFTTVTTPATPASFPIYIKNQETTPSTYNLTDSVPPGWTVKFVPSTGTCASAAVTQPIAVASGAQVEVLACVTPPAGTTPGTTPITVTATKSTDPTVYDTITDAVKVTLPVQPGMALGPNIGSNTTPNGGTTVQPVTLTNTGTTTCGLGNGFNVALSLDSASQAAGWTATVYYDVTGNGVIDANAKLIASTAVVGTTANLTGTVPVTNTLVPLLPAPGNTKGLPMLVKLFAPTNATIGSTATATLTVTDLDTATPTQTCPAQTGKYSDTVTNGQLSVLKTQAQVSGSGTSPAITCNGASMVSFAAANLSVKPGDCIVYQVVATNTGNSPVTSVVLSDAMPAYTVYNATQPVVQCAATGNTGAPLFSQTGSGAATTAVACSNTTTGVTLAPLGTLTLYYAVQVQQ